MSVEAFQWRSVLLAVPLGILASTIAVVVASVNPLIALVLVGGGALFVIACMQPLWLLYLAVLALPLEFEVQHVGFFDLSPAKGLLIVAAGGWVISQIVHRRPLVVDTPLTLPLIALIVVILPGLLIAEDTFVVVNTLGTWVVMFCLFQAVVQANDPKFVRRMLIALAISGLVLGILAITDSSFQGEAASSGGNTTNRADASFGSPNVLAAMLLITIFPAACLMFAGPTWRRVFFALAAGIGVYGLLLTGSRGAFLGLAAGILAVVTWRPVRRAAIVGVLVLATLAFGGLSPLGPLLEKSEIGARITSITGGSATRTDPRIPVYRRTLEIIGDHPLFGVGANDYVAAAVDYGIHANGFAPSHAHSAPLTIAADRGLLGLAALIFLVLALARLLAHGMARSRGERRAMITGITAVFMATAAHNTVDYTLGAVPIGLLLVVAGCAVVLIRVEDPEPVPVSQPGA